jgi:hypothetical protein
MSSHASKFDQCLTCVSAHNKTRMVFNARALGQPQPTTRREPPRLVGTTRRVDTDRVRVHFDAHVRVRAT